MFYTDTFSLTIILTLILTLIPASNIFLYFLNPYPKRHNPSKSIEIELTLSIKINMWRNMSKSIEIESTFIELYNRSKEICDVIRRNRSKSNRRYRTLYYLIRRNRSKSNWRYRSKEICDVICRNRSKSNRRYRTLYYFWTSMN